MKYVLFFLFVFTTGFSQSYEKIKADILKFQNDLDKEYKNSQETPLRGDNFKNFKGHPFFPVNLKYRVKARFSRTENAEPFEFPTSSGKTKTYREYGTVTFEIDGKPYTLTLYQSLALLNNPQYKDYLFLPFKDGTSGKETYGGGKYLDLKIPEGNTIIIDFNKSYHPYCAYNAYDYSCPIVPEKNWLPVRIEAGVKYDEVYFH